MIIPTSIPTPMYEMRRRLAVRSLRSMQPGSFLEAGCGWGELLPTLVDLGFSGFGIEPSNEARSVALARTASIRSSVNVVSTIDEVGNRLFDYLMAFEVLEHLEHDEMEMSRWIKRLRPGGMCLISVPAHQDRWSGSDEAAGHVRRYSPGSLRELHESVGLKLLRFYSYGFPVSSVTRRIRGLSTGRAGLSRSRRERTLGSAARSHSLLYFGGPKTRSLARGLGLLADTLQRPFLRTAWGDGFFVISRKL